MESFRSNKGYTLVELLCAIAIISILVALAIPNLSRAKQKSGRVICMANLRQINASIRMYADDSDDALPPAGTNRPSFTAYAKLIKRYVGMNESADGDRVFACPADTFYYDIHTLSRASIIHQPLCRQPDSGFSSYAFNGGNFAYGADQKPRWPGIAGKKLSSIRQPSRTILILEMPGLMPYSWHEPAAKPGYHNNARCAVSYVDGHAEYTKMYWDHKNAKKDHLESWQYDPPANYNYKWSGD